MQRKAVLPLRDAKSGNANQMKALCGKETLVKLYIRLLGAKSPFSQQNLQRDVLDRDEETARIQYLTEIAKFLGIMTTVDTEVIQGHGSYEDRTEMLRLIVYIVEATIYADNSEWRLLLVAKDTQLINSIAEKQSQIFSEKYKLCRFSPYIHCQKFSSSRQNFLKSKKFVESSTKSG